MSDGLSSYIQQGQPQQVVADEAMAQPGGPSPAEVVSLERTGEPSSGAPAHIVPSGPPAQEYPEPTTPDPRDEVIRQYQEQLTAQAQETAYVRQQQAAESARREEAQIMAQIQAIPDEDERNQAYHTYRHNRDAAVIQAQAAQIQSTHQQRAQTEQEIARNSVVTIRALQEGVPMDYVPLLKRSESPQELEQNLQVIKRNLGLGQIQSQQATRQGIVNSGVYAAGGAQAGYIPPEMPQPHSGDLAGLIAATPPRFS